MTDAHVLTPEELRRLDAEYRPIEPFDAWADLAPPASVWDRYVERYDAARAEASPEALAAALADVTRGAAFDTGAIEGLYAGDRGITHTVMTQAATWEAYVAQERGPQVVDFVKAHVEAFEMALDLATGQRPVTETWVRQVHEVVCAPQDVYEVTTPVGRQSHELVKGAYTTQPNHVLQPDGTPFAYAPVDQVGAEMARLVAEARRPEFEAAHPATQAAYLHHSFVRVHPFPDGNGRVARVLASVPLLRSLSVPLVVFADERPAYLDALRATDHGDRAALVHFVADRVLDTVVLVELAVDEQGSTVDAVHRALLAFEGRSDPQLRAVAERVLDAAVGEWQRQVDAVGLPGASYAAVLSDDDLGGVTDYLGPTYRPLSSGTRIATLSIAVQSPRPTSVVDRLAVGVARAAEEPFVLRLGRQFDANGPHAIGPLDVRRTDVDPALTTSFRLRLRGWIRRLVTRQANQLLRQLT